MPDARQLADTVREAFKYAPDYVADAVRDQELAEAALDTLVELAEKAQKKISSQRAHISDLEECREDLRERAEKAEAQVEQLQTKSVPFLMARAEKAEEQRRISDLNAADTLERAETDERELAEARDWNAEKYVHRAEKAERLLSECAGRNSELEEALRKIEEIITYADAPEGCVDRILDFCALAAKEATKGISQGHMMDVKGEMGGYQG